MAFITTGGYWQDQGYYEDYSNPQFDAGARTIEELTADGAFTFTVGQATGIVCGLNAVDLDSDYLEIEHAFYIENGRFRVVENGVFKTAFSNYTTGAAFKIERIGGVVKYYVDNNLKYTSLSASTGTVFLDCSLYAANDTIILGEVTTLNPSETLEIELPKPSIDFLENADTANIIIELSPPELYLEELLVYELHITLPKPELDFLVEGESRLIIDLPKPTIFIRETLIVPDYSILQFSLPKPQLRLNEEENLSLDIELPLAVVISEVPDFCHITLPKPLIGFQEETQNFFLMEWPRWTLDFEIFINEVILTIPSPKLVVSGTVHSFTVDLEIPAPTLSIYGGGTTKFTIPAPTLTIAGTVQQLARVEFEIPSPELAITGKVGSIGLVAFEIPAPELSVFSGGRVVLEIPAPVLAVTGNVSHLARVELTIPAPVVAVTGEVYGLARVDFEIPAPILYVGRGNYVGFEIPEPILVVTATVVGTPTEAAAETTYAINMNTGAVTQLLLGGFDRMVAAHGRLYGIKNGALTRMEGDIDGTNTPIQATVRFAQQTFGSNMVKRISDVYWSTRENDGISMDLIADENTVWRYQTPTDTAPAYGTCKIKTGRGVTFHTAGFVLRNRSGGKLDIGGGEFLVNPLSRKPK